MGKNITDNCLHVVMHAVFYQKCQKKCKEHRHNFTTSKNCTYNKPKFYKKYNNTQKRHKMTAIFEAYKPKTPVQFKEGSNSN